jgi:hypothetical protein
MECASLERFCIPALVDTLSARSFPGSTARPLPGLKLTLEIDVSKRKMTL